MKIYQVGGSIRDELLGINPKDKDWVVVGSSPELMIKEGYKPVGKDFPVFIHPKSNEEYALARTEKKDGYGYKGFKFYHGADVTLEEDLSRRDLTINAIAKDPKGKLIDPFGGIDDIKNKKFKHVSPAFLEDPLRAIRVARFKTYPHLKDFEINESTKKMLLDIGNSGELKHLSKDRIWKEIELVIESNHATNFFKFLLDFDLSNPWLKDLTHPECQENVTPQAKWADLEFKNDFLLGQSIPIPNRYKVYIKLLKNLIKINTNTSNEELVEIIEELNFHRNLNEISDLLLLNILETNKEFIKKLGDNIIKEDFASLKDVKKSEVKSSKLELIKRAIGKTYE